VADVGAHDGVRRGRRPSDVGTAVARRVAAPPLLAPLQLPFVADNNWPVSGAKPPEMLGADTAIGAAVCQSGVASPAWASSSSSEPHEPPTP